MEKKLTGYPHIDRQEQKWYSEEQLKKKNYEMNFTEYLREENKGRENKIGRTYYGKEETFQEMYDKQDDASRVFSQLGIKNQDRVACLLPNIPEAGDIWLGNTQIGIVSDFIDLRPDSMDIEIDAKKKLEIFRDEKINYIVALEQSYLFTIKPIEHELKDMGIDIVVTVSPTDSMDLKGKISYLKDVIMYNKLRNEAAKEEAVKQLKWYQALLNSLKQTKDMGEQYKEAIKDSPLKIFSYRDLVRECKNSSFEVLHDADLLHYIGHTSGTTGNRPKPITANHKQSIAQIDQTIRAKAAFGEGDKVLHVLPFFAPFGAYDNYCLNIAKGSINIEVPEFVINEFGYLIKKYRPNGVMATPAWLTSLLKCKYLTAKDIRYLKKFVYGGAAMSKEDEEAILNWARKMLLEAKLPLDIVYQLVIELGFGMSEGLGALTYARGKYHKPNCMGIPLPDTTFAIIDPNNTEKMIPLKFKEGEQRLSGELAVSGPSITKGELDRKVIIPHYELDGKDYIRTRDIVETDREGVYYHKDRKDRSFSRHDGFKIIPYEIEKAIQTNTKVRYAVIVPYFSEKDRGIMPMCHLVLNDIEASNDEKLKVVNEIVYQQILGNSDMVSRQIPIKFKFRESLPISKGGKMDYLALTIEPLNGDEINVDILESNLNMSGIEIYQNREKKKSLKK